MADFNGPEHQRGHRQRAKTPAPFFSSRVMNNREKRLDIH
jgi:hypothetical protein